MKISITANNKQFQAAVDRMVEKQIPFATSLALNETLRFVRDDDLKKGYQRKFAFRNRAFFQQVHTIRPSNVAHWKKAGVLVAAIQENRLKAPTGAATGSKRGFKVPSNTRFPKNAGNNSLTKGKSADTAFMNKHVTGGVRKPKGRMKAIPYRGAPITRLASTGAVSRGLQPKTLLETFNTGAKNPKNFIIYKPGTHEKNNPGSGKPMFLARKVGKGKNQQIQKLYHFTTEIKNKAKYNPEQIVVSGIRRRMPFQFKRALIRAINTARFNV